MNLKTLPRYALAGAIIAGSTGVGLGASTPATARETCIDGGLTYQADGQTINVPACGNTPQCKRYDMETGDYLGPCGKRPASGSSRTSEKPVEQAGPARPKSPAKPTRTEVRAKRWCEIRKTCTSGTRKQTSTTKQPTSNGDRPDWLRQSDERRARVTGGRN